MATGGDGHVSPEVDAEVRVLYLGCFSVDTMGNPAMICDAWNRKVTNDTDENSEMTAAVNQMLATTATYFSAGTLHTVTLGRREAYAYDFVREGRWRILTVLQTNDDPSLSAIVDAQERAKDTLRVMWRDFIRYRHQEDGPELRNLLVQVDEAKSGVRFGDHIRTAPYILMSRDTRRVSFGQHDEDGDQTDSLIYDRGSPSASLAKRLALLRFFWCMFLFTCVWMGCLVCGTCVCLAGLLTYAAVAGDGAA